MLDPYMVLGVGKYDDDQTVKKAYRQLSKQYHPDNNLNNPNKDAAEETFKKIQQAYEQIMHERSLGIGGPDDLRKKQNESATSQSSSWNSSNSSDSSNGNSSWNSGYSSASSSRNSSWNSSYNSSYNGNTGSQGYSWNGNASNSSQWGSTRTKEKEDYNKKESFWNRTGFTNNTGNNGTSSGTYSNGGYYSSNPNTNNSYGNTSTGGYYSGNNTYSGFTSNNDEQNGYYGEDTNAFLSKVAENLNKRNFYEAWDVLNTMQNRNDVWYYYSAIANLGLGNTITALQHARTAKSMSPDRPEYDELINGIQSGTLHYRGKSEMFVPQKQGNVNTCLRIGIAMIFFNLFCGGGGAVCGSMGMCMIC